MAGTHQLTAPRTDINKRDLVITEVSRASLCRVSQHNTGEPHFGRTGDCRFDDTQPDVTKHFVTATLASISQLNSWNRRAYRNVASFKGPPQSGNAGP